MSRRRSTKKKPALPQTKKGASFGEWLLIDEIGRGGNGHVWRARPASGGSEVAIKLLAKDHTDAQQRFLDEIHAQRVLAEAGVALPILDVSPESDPNKWFAMPLAEGIVNSLKGKSVQDKVWMFLKLCRSLSVIHAKAFSHRDIKPENMMVHEGRPVFSDFGLVQYPKKTYHFKLEFYSLTPVFLCKRKIGRDARHTGTKDRCEVTISNFRIFPFPIERPWALCHLRATLLRGTNGRPDAVSVRLS